MQTEVRCRLFWFLYCSHLSQSGGFTFLAPRSSHFLGIFRVEQGWPGLQSGWKQQNWWLFWLWAASPSPWPPNTARSLGWSETTPRTLAPRPFQECWSWNLSEKPRKMCSILCVLIYTSDVSVWNIDTSNNKTEFYKQILVKKIEAN